MSMMINQFDPGYSVSVIALGETQQSRWVFTPVAMVMESPELRVNDVAPGRVEPVQMNMEDDCERWDGLS